MIYLLLIQQLLFGILTLFIIYSIGKIFVSFIDVQCNFFLRLFILYIIGILAIVLFYSIAKAYGRTNNIFLLPIIVFLLYQYRFHFTKKLCINKHGIIKELIWSLIPFVFIFIYQSFFYFDFGKNELKPLFGDYYWYASFTDSLKLWGTENYFTTSNFFFPYIREGLMPYHYPELWLNAFFSSFFKLSTLNCYYFCICPLLTSIFILGIVSLFEQISKSKILLISIAFFVCFISGITIPALTSGIQNDVWSITSLGQKVAFEYIFILLAFILIRNKNEIVGIVILLCIPLFSVTFLPSIYGGLIIYLLNKIVFSKGKMVKQYLLVFVSIFTILILYGMFYSSFKSILSTDFTRTITSTGIFNVLKNGISLKNIFIVLMNFVVYAIPTIIIHLYYKSFLFIIFLVLLSKSLLIEKKILFLCFSIILSGAIGATLTNHLHDSEQFNGITNTILILFCILLFANFIVQCNQTRTIKNYCILALLSILIIIGIPKIITEKRTAQSEDMSFIKKSSELLSGDSIVVLSFFKNEDIQRFPFYNFWFSQNGINTLTQYSNKTMFFLMGNPEMYSFKSNKSREFDSLCYHFLTPLTIWRNKSSQNNLQSFIQKFNIKYFYCKAGVEVPLFISQNAEKVITSPINHNRFYKIK